MTKPFVSRFKFTILKMDLFHKNDKGYRDSNRNILTTSKQDVAENKSSSPVKLENLSDARRISLEEANMMITKLVKMR